jgi:hypothetical protein
VLAAGGLALASYWTVVDEEGLARLAMALIAVSPAAYLVLTAIGKAISPPEWEPPPESAARPPRRRRHELMRAAVAAAREVLVDPATEPGVRRIALTIRPRPPQPGAAAPAELAVWLRNGTLSTDGTSLTVTERTGRTYRIPLAGAGGPASYGAATLLVVRESVVTSTQYGRSVPRSRELLCVLDSADRRMVDIELYGWTRSDLVALARAAGLRLDRYAPQERQHAVANLRGRAPTALDVAIPKVTAHRTVRGSSPWRDVPLIITIAVATVAGYFGVAHVLGVVRAELAQPEPWQTIAAGLVGVAMVSVLVFTVRRLGTWHEQRRQAARTRSTDAP